MRLPLTLYAYISRELLRLLLLTAFVLAWIIAFAAAVRPITEGQLSPAGALKYVTLAMAPMLQFAVPFAAGFAATLAYNRLSSDNELLGCTASGISYRSILAPAVLTGLLLSAGLLILAHEVVPGVMKRMENMLREDVGSFLVSAINRGDGVQMEGWSVYADEAYRYGPDEQSGADERIVLMGVAAAETRGNKDRPSIFTARQALIRLYKGAEETVVEMYLTDVSALSKGSRGRTTDYQKAWRVPNALKRDPKFETFSQLSRVYHDPDLYPAIHEVGLTLAEAIGRWQIIRTVDLDLRRDGQAELVDTQRNITYIIEGKRIAWRSLPGGYNGPYIAPVEDTGIVTVTRYMNDGSVLRYQAKSAVLEPAHYGEGHKRGAYFILKMEGNVTVRDLSAHGETNEIPSYVVKDLHLRNDPSVKYISMSSEELLQEAADEKYLGDEFIQPQAAALRERIAHLRREIISKYHERAAISLSCLVMMFTGAVMAIRLKNTLPLIVYMWSFLPALVTIILISSGQQVMESESVAAGAYVMWSGVTALALMGVVVLFQVRKH